MNGGHSGHSAADCTDCWEIAYEPGWYAVMRAGEGLIQLPEADGGEATLRLPESAVIDRTRGATHAPVTVRRDRPAPGPGTDARSA